MKPNEIASSPSIAIIGMACEFPGAHSPEELWQNVLAGRRYFRTAPAERLPAEYFDFDAKAPDKSYCNRMAVLTDWSFDPLKFRIPPVTIQASDIAHWLALHTASEAIKNAKLDLDAIERTRVGVILGNSLTGEFSRSHALRLRWPYVERAFRRALASQLDDSESLEHLLETFRRTFEAPLPAATEDTLAGNMANTIAGRICNYFDFGGGGFTVDGACSSSLLGVGMACNALVSGQMDVALAGGVDVSLDPFEIVGFAKTQALARDDIRPYDERAGGMITGEGCGIVVLMHESEARARGLAVHALIKGWAFSSDGSGGITAPEVKGQMRALSRAYEVAGYPMSRVQLIEGHGTGTPLGDKVELTAIQNVLKSGEAEFDCVIGSIKANIGHTKAAAGAAGLIKAIQALKYKILPPTVSCERPNPVFSQSNWRLRPSLRGQVWKSNGGPRRAAVSSMGFGGANSHVTLEEANPEASPSSDHLDQVGSHQNSELIVLHSDNKEMLLGQIRQFISVADRICLAELTDLSAALCKRPIEGRLRFACVVDSPWSLSRTLQQAVARLEEGAALQELDDPSNGIYSGETVSHPSLVALFPGQGSQRLNMAERLRERYPFVRELFDRACVGFAGQVFKEVIGAPANQLATWESELKATQVAQPAIVAASAATLQVLNFLGLRPSVAVGHSLGEISALSASGAFPAETAVRVATLRGQTMGSFCQPMPGGMLAVAADPNHVLQLIKEVEPSLAISNYNSPRQTVVSGPTPAIHALKARCDREQIRSSILPVSNAFHSELVAPASGVFRRALEGIPVAPLGSNAVQVVSTDTGSVLEPEQDLRALLADHIRHPVRFVEAVQRAAALQPDLWLEVGPGGVLTALVREILGARQVRCLPTDLKNEDAHHLLNHVLAQAFVLGFPLHLENLFAHRFHRPFDPDNFHPVFITNPCERPVEIGSEELGRSLSSKVNLRPDGIDAAEFDRYLTRRKAYLRDLIAVDFHHSLQTPIAQVTSPAASCAPEIHRSSAKAVNQGRQSHTGAETKNESLLDYAVQWIAKRTGFPQESIKPGMKLRDDLNLDSIKSGELVLNLSQKLKRPLTGDPALFANARLQDLIDLLVQSNADQTSQQELRKTRRVPGGSAESLGHWARSFRMAEVPFPLDQEKELPLPKSGTVVVVGREDCPRACALRHGLQGTKLTVIHSQVASLVQSSAAPRDLVALLLVLPEHTKAFFNSTPEEFRERVEQLSEDVFRLFRWVGHGRDGDWSTFRTLLLRPAASTDNAADLDGLAGLLKTLRLEHIGANCKFVRLPAEWPVERFTETAACELEKTSERVAFYYKADGSRFTDMALPLTQPVQTPTLLLGPNDVVTVTGGAKGITAELALALGRRTGVRLALLGTSPKPAADDPKNEIAANLRRFADAGLRCGYYSCDVTDAASVQRAVADAERELGPISGILHGAGITKLQLFREKPLPDFLDCIRVKAAGLFNLVAAVKPERLKMLHVVSSVLGKSGMRGQSDYTLANAWLDGAVRSLQTAYPKAHYLSLGYTVWEGTGLGAKLGAVEYLLSIGVRPLNIQEGVDEYLALIDHAASGPVFITTGNLTPDLEANLYPALPAKDGRFLERLRRWVPRTELSADAKLSHDSDPYLAEHIYRGTSLFPGVMAIEAMVQAASACLETDELPVLRNIRFSRPLITPEDASVIIRTLALAEKPRDGVTRVRVAIRSDCDGYQANHFEGECWYGLPKPAKEALPSLPPIPEPMPVDPETLHPTPLFQGKFFRRIKAVHQMDPLKAALAKVEVPDQARYFGAGLSAVIQTPAPAARDAFLQTGALMLPPGCLPESIEELRLSSELQDQKAVWCLAPAMDERDGKFVCSYAAFTETGECLETVSGLVLGRPQTDAATTHTTCPTPIPLKRLPSDLAALAHDTPHALVVMRHADAVNAAEMTEADLTRIQSKVSNVRQAAASAGLVAVRRACAEFARKHLKSVVNPHQVALDHRTDGKPELRFEDPALQEVFGGIDVALADVHGLSIALVGPGPLGVDIEMIETRNAELWGGLVGDDGYRMARQIARERNESFDCAATRQWTLIEAGKKAANLGRILPKFDGLLGGPWLAFASESDSLALAYYNSTVKLQAESKTYVVTVAFGKRSPVANKGTDSAQ